MDCLEGLNPKTLDPAEGFWDLGLRPQGSGFGVWVRQSHCHSSRPNLMVGKPPADKLARLHFLLLELEALGVERGG